MWSSPKFTIAYRTSVAKLISSQSGCNRLKTIVSVDSGVGVISAAESPLYGIISTEAFKPQLFVNSVIVSRSVIKILRMDT